MVDRALPTVLAGGPGGMMACEFTDSSTGERHPLRFYVAPFTPLPMGAQHDYLYTGVGPYPPSETGILATFAALGALWAQYYPPSWALMLVAVAENRDGVLTILPTVPTAAPVAGTGAATLPAGVSVRRQFTLRAARDDDQKFWLWQMPGTQVDIGSAVTPGAGGIDARDRALMAYLAGPHTAIRSQRGKPWSPDGSVLIWWSERRVAPQAGGEGTRDQFIGPVPPDLPQNGWLWVDTSVGAPPWNLKVWDAGTNAWEVVGGGGGGTTGDCLTFPLGARLCNADADVVTLTTPTGLHLWDPTGYTLPGGHRLEVVS